MIPFSNMYQFIHKGLKGLQHEGEIPHWALEGAMQMKGHRQMKEHESIQGLNTRGSNIQDDFLDGYITIIELH